MFIFKHTLPAKRYLQMQSTHKHTVVAAATTKTLGNASLANVLHPILDCSAQSNAINASMHDTRVHVTTRQTRNATIN